MQVNSVMANPPREFNILARYAGSSEKLMAVAKNGLEYVDDVPIALNLSQYILL